MKSVRQTITIVIFVLGLSFVIGILSWILYPTPEEIVAPIQTTANPQPSSTATPGVYISLNCTYPLGYWLQHPERFPAQLAISDQLYDAVAIGEILGSASSDSITRLLQEMIVAYLNFLSGADQSAVGSTVAEAFIWLRTHPAGSNLPEAELMQSQELIRMLEDFNQGRLGPGSCEVGTPLPSPTPSATPTAPPPTTTFTPTPSATASMTPAEAASATAIPATSTAVMTTPAPSLTATISTPRPTPFRTRTPTPTKEPRDTATAIPPLPTTPVPTVEPTSTPSLTPEPTEVPSPTPVPTEVPSPTPIP